HVEDFNSDANRSSRIVCLFGQFASREFAEVRLPKRKDARSPRDHFLEKFQPLCHQACADSGQSCDVSPRSCQADCVSVTDGVKYDWRDDRYCRGGLVGSSQALRIGKDQIDVEPDQLGGKLSKSVDLAICIAVVYYNISALLVTKLMHSFK